MKASFKWGPHMVIMSDQDGVVCQDQDLREYLEAEMIMETDGPTVSPTDAVLTKLQRDATIEELMWIEDEVIY